MDFNRSSLSSISQLLGIDKPSDQKPVFSDSDLDLFESKLRATSVTQSDAFTEDSSASIARQSSSVQLKTLFSEDEALPPPPLPVSKVISSVDAPEGGKICTVRKADGRLSMRIEYNREQVLKYSESPVCVIPPASIRQMVLEMPEILAPFPVRHGYKPNESRLPPPGSHGLLRQGDMKRLLPFVILLLQVWPGWAAFSSEGCNSTRSCWFHPPDCLLHNNTPCLSAVRWAVEPDGIFLQVESNVADLDPTRPYYASVGFSYNQRMDDDTVVDCVQPQNGPGRVQISFNDETFNEVLPQASSVLLKDTSSILEDGVLTCSAKLLLDNRQLVYNDSQFKIHDLETGGYYLLFARGSADQFTLEKDIHSTNDGPTFPWMTDEQVTFCRENCSVSNIFDIVQMHQTTVSRYWRYRISVLHGIALLFAWWVLGSSAILIARYFKPLFPRTKLLGTAVWYQLHRDFWLVSLILQIVSVVFIFYQSGWVWYQCSYKCTSDDFAKKMHTLTGVAATGLAICQPFLAFLRPSPNAASRPVFNWIHWLIGMSAWTLASTTMVLAIPMGKTGLNKVFGHAPNWIFGGYIAFFLLINVVMEAIAKGGYKTDKISEIQPHRYIVGPSGMALANINGPSSEAQLSPPTRAGLRLFLFFLHLVVALGVWITLIVMLVSILWQHSP